MEGRCGEEGEGDGRGEVGRGKTLEESGDQGGVETEEKLVGVEPVKLMVMLVSTPHPTPGPH